MNSGSMGHDTSLRDRFYDVEVESEFAALNMAWDKMREIYFDEIKEIYKKKGLSYFPYHYIRKTKQLI